MVTPVSFAKGVIDQVRAHAASSSDEVCGLLFGDPDRVDAAAGCRNVAADPTSAFEIDPAQLIAAHRAARAGGPRLVGCYHSHPSGDATPSRRDAAAADANEWLWVIVGGGGARVFRAVADGSLRGSFEEITVTD